MAAIRARSGKFQARINRKGFPLQEKTFTSREDAYKWARQVEAAMELGLFKPPTLSSPMTLAEALDRYGETVSPNKRGGGVELVRLACLKRLKLARSRLSDIKAPDIAKYRDDRLKLVSAATVRRELVLLAHLFRVAVSEWGFDFANPCAAIRKPVEPAGRDRIFIADEEVRLLAELDKAGGYGDLARLALATAMRRGELLALTWQNIDTSRRVALLPITKNGESRCVPLAPEALAVLGRQVRPPEGGPVFGLTVEALKSAWRRAIDRAHKRYQRDCLERAEVPNGRMFLDLHFHDLRHIATTRLARKIPNTIELSRITGHKSLTMLARYYSTRPEDLAAKLAA